MQSLGELWTCESLLICCCRYDSRVVKRKIAEEREIVKLNNQKISPPPCWISCDWQPDGFLESIKKIPQKASSGLELEISLRISLLTRPFLKRQSNNNSSLINGTLNAYKDNVSISNLDKIGSRMSYITTLPSWISNVLKNPSGFYL